MNVKTFVVQEYNPYIDSALAISTRNGYHKLWKKYESYISACDLDIRVSDAQKILNRIAGENPHLRKTSLYHIKNFFSGVWSHAVRIDQTPRNPWAGHSVSIPVAPDPGETWAYSPAEIEIILSAVPAPADLVVFLAACTGLRKSEIRGLKWQDWDSSQRVLHINRAVWRTTTKTTKSKASKAPVLVIEPLAAKLDSLKKSSERFIFSNSVGGALDLDNLARRVIIPALAGTDVRWKGYHAFRRGLATWLHSQDVDPKTIQTILRHGDMATTMRCYVKTVPESVRKAMQSVTFGGKQ